MRPTRGLFAHLALGNYNLLNTCYVQKKPARDCLLSLKENREGAEGRGGCTQAKQHDGREKYCEVEGLSLLVIDQKEAM